MPFRDIVGHRRLVGLVARSIRRGTLPPSLILAGPHGVGKRLLAIAAAQALNCQNLQTSAAGEIDACGTCASCSKIDRGVHPDVLVVEPGDTGTIKIDQVRDVIDRAGYRPFEGRRRAVIIDQADALVPQAQNALLKTLEEPPGPPFNLVLTLLPLACRASCGPDSVWRTADDAAAVLMKQGAGGSARDRRQTVSSRLRERRVPPTRGRPPRVEQAKVTPFYMADSTKELLGQYWRWQADREQSR
jgi:hypothetical protein